ncbi:MAG TPA: ricin-type beta-trefoil lectin domain protein [Actinocrinis sp.]|nr:ricin-type beta-trefoil lectin domain protein [Actinocrinis sp.]
MPSLSKPRLGVTLAAVASLLGALSIGALSAPPALAEANGVATTPLMGWSSWSFVRKDPTAAKIDAQADAMKSSGLAAVGYQYINIDDFSMSCNSNGPEVDSNGYWLTDTSKFPGGMSAVASHVHGDGLKFGMYVTPGIPENAILNNPTIEGTSDKAASIAETNVTENNYNCGNMHGINYSAAGAQAYINGWADELASWGVDYIKIDGVGTGDIADIQAWSTALKQTGRPIALELSNNLAISDGSTWATLANGWRTNGDIECYCGSNGSSFPLTDWGNVSSRFNSAAAWQPYAGPVVEGWNDMDSVEVGNGSNDGLTVPERQSQLSLWSLASAPLILGSDLTNLDSGDLALLKNKAVIAVDQDATPADRLATGTNEQVFDKRESGGDFVLGIFNTDTSNSHSFTVNLATAGLTGTANLTDLWSGSSLGSGSSVTVTVQPGGVALIKATPATGTAGTKELKQSASGKCVDTYKELYTPSTKEELWDCNGGYNQEISPTSAGELRTQNATECLDVYNNETAAGSLVQLYPCNGGANQKWTVESNGEVVGQQSGKCLDASGGGTGDGTQLVINTCTDGSSQKWSWN